MEVVVTTAAIRRAKLQSNHQRQQTNTQLFTGRMTFLRPTNSVRASQGEDGHDEWTSRITAADWFASRFHFHRAWMQILNIVDSDSSPSPGTESSAREGDSWMPQTYTACRCTLCRPADHPVSSQHPQTYTACRCTLCRPADHPVSSQHPSMTHSPTFSFSLSLF